MSRLKDAIEDLLNNRKLTVDEAADKHFTPDFRQRTNGRWEDRTTVIARLTDFRKVIAQATVTILNEFDNAKSYAERHIIEIVTHDGERICQEVYVFAERDNDQRFTKIEETTLKLDT
ncbi:hypothetical protein [Gynuella sp.]|uniref:hypothetical protein n=1 Tax=Gynuella sp. TaxID=2969146 RepID=UPI003D127105